ncbi:hypothetical protein C8F01DRAFT_1261819 [Mycena amicta]|nr:hypothetical protein C8F01DRAFT_1261819 [Mycena amicta]
MDNLLSAAHAARRRTHIPRYREDLEESSSRAPIEIPQPIDDDHATLYSFTLVYHHPVGIPYPAVLAVILDLPPSMPVHPQRSVVINESASLFRVGDNARRSMERSGTSSRDTRSRLVLRSGRSRPSTSRARLSLHKLA